MRAPRTGWVQAIGEVSREHIGVDRLAAQHGFHRLQGCEKTFSPPVTTTAGAWGFFVSLDGPLSRCPEPLEHGAHELALGGGRQTPGHGCHTRGRLTHQRLHAALRDVFDARFHSSRRVRATLDVFLGSSLLLILVDNRRDCVEPLFASLFGAIPSALLEFALRLVFPGEGLSWFLVLEGQGRARLAL